MTKFFRIGAAGVALAAAAVANPAFAQASATADARAEILSALTLEVETGSALDFGAVVIQSNLSPATLIMGEDGVLDCSDANLVCSGTNDVPVFNISGGTANRTVKVNLPTADSLTPLYIYLNGTATTDDTQRLELYDFTTDATFNAASTVDVYDAYNNLVSTDPVAAYYSVDLDGSGDGSFTVGGTLHFDGDELAGAYSGTFDVSVDYM